MPVNPIQVQKFLGGVDYPTKKDQLIETARQKGADQEVLDTLSAMPDRPFDSPNDVAEAIGEEFRGRKS